MADSLHFELVSPEKLLMEVDATMVTVPGSEGDFGVLPDHAPVMATIRPGLVEVFEVDKAESTKLFVNGGFAEVTPTGLVILAEEAINTATVDKAELVQRVQDAREDVEDAKTDDQIMHAQSALEHLEGILAAVNA